MRRMFFKSKYKSKSTVIDGIFFHSKKESMRYLYLKIELAKGNISELVLQPQFKLQESFKLNGETHRGISYYADFSYKKDGKNIIEDVKGMKTEVYKIKKKLFLKNLPANTVFVEV